MNHPIIISIDWDHTFRNMSGLDLNILAIARFAKSKQISVGLTTHRDIENTTLYTLYYWQYEKPQDNSDALAAAISYWDQHVFKPLNLAFDFINARYQPISSPHNYYKTTLYPLEKKLAEEINNHHILNDKQMVKNKIQEYVRKEPLMENNEFKQAQIAWLINQYTTVDMCDS